MNKDEFINRTLESKCLICNSQLQDNEETSEEVYEGMVVKIHKKHIK